MTGRARYVATAGLLLVASVSRAEIPAPKLDLIKQAMSAMKVDARVHALVAARVEGKVQSIRALNPGISDSLVAEARAVVSEVYARNMDGPGGLFPRVYAVLDRRLSADDLRFAVDFKGSDQGRRYREMVPRIVSESVEEGRAWAERLEPEVRRRLEDRLRGSGTKL